MGGRDVGLALLVAAAVMAAAGYLWFQGRAHAVEFAVTQGRVQFVAAADPVVPQSWLAPRTPRLLIVDVAWEAAEPIGGGAYYVLVTPPPGWIGFACEPGCDWASTPDLERFAAALPRRTYRDGARFSADESSRVKVGFVPRPGQARRDAAFSRFSPSAWLVQTDGDNVLGSRRIQ